jgi:hypothetical protein
VALGGFADGQLIVDRRPFSEEQLSAAHPPSDVRVVYAMDPARCLAIMQESLARY